MKKITLSLLISLVIFAAAGVISEAKEVEALTGKIIRIHVIANSDSEADQRLKIKVRDGILETVADITSGCGDKASAMAAIGGNIENIKSAAERAISESDSGYGVTCTLKKEEFDRREYDDFTLPAGEYDSLCIRIGEAKGKNWWCVCFPSVCVGAAVKIDDCEVFTDGELMIVKEPQKVRYKLWCFEAVRRIKKFFESL